MMVVELPENTEGELVEGVTLNGGIASGVTVKAMLTTWSATPFPEARTLKLVVPGEVAPSESVRVLAATPAPSVDGENSAVTPKGRFSTLSVTGPVKEPTRPMLIGMLTWVP